MSGQRVSQKYAFTVTLKPKLYDHNAEDQYDKTSTVLEQSLAKVGHHFTCVTELTKSANIHYHGVIDFEMNHPNFIKKFHDHFRCRCSNKYKCKCLFGYVNIKVLEKEDGWKDYISKELKVTYDSISRRPIVRDDFNYFPLSTFELYGFYVV